MVKNHLGVGDFAECPSASCTVPHAQQVLEAPPVLTYVEGGKKWYVNLALLREK